MLRAILLLLFSLNVHADTLSLCAYHNWAPWVYLKNGGYDGLMIEQVDKFKEKYPEIKIEIKEIKNWKRCQAEVASGRITMVLGAYKTHERKEIFDYLPTPAVINISAISAYTSNNSIDLANSLDDLRKYTVSVERGSSFGAVVDSFIKSLPASNAFESNSFDQSIKLVLLNRVDYVFMSDSQYESIGDLNSVKYPYLKHLNLNLKFRKIFTVTRDIPIFYIFGKGTGNYGKFAEKWLNVIKYYQENVVIEERIQFHKEHAGD
ncbi:MAG: transporter substrate-binding domain-containing protein [Oceanospirillaceae bacterium]|nr:transporter substrate-binding domain-containing protein [Oceanospirillaceae bacterium]